MTRRKWGPNPTRRCCCSCDGLPARKRKPARIQIEITEPITMRAWCTGQQPTTIDYGDGTIDSGGAILSHSYETSGIYDIVIRSDAMPELLGGGNGKRPLGIVIKDYGTLCWNVINPLAHLSQGLSWTPGSYFVIEKIPEYDNYRNVTSNMSSNLYISHGTFATSSLVTIPPGLLDSAVDMLNCIYLFSEAKIHSIPEDLFYYCRKNVYFNSCFLGCKSLKSVPRMLFKNNNDVISFAAVFCECDALTEIPSGLLSGKLKAYDFESFFSRCTNLRTVPDDFFSETAATNFDRSFYSCTALTSAPKLWEKFPTAISRLCYTDCHLLPWYDEIPYAWKQVW